MELAKGGPTQKLFLWSALVVGAHFLGVLWHLALLVKVQPSTPKFLPPGWDPCGAQGDRDRVPW